MRARELTRLIHSLLEGMNDTSAYIKTEIPILDYFEQNKDRLKINSDPAIYHFSFQKDLLTQYKTHLKEIAFSPNWKYIYQLKQRVETFWLKKVDDISHLIEKGILINSASNAVPNFDGVRRFINWEKVNELGIVAFIKKDNKYVEVLVSEDKVEPFLNGLELVDGNARRFDTGTMQDMSIPSNVLRELIDYTNARDDTFSEEVKSWLKKIEKPYKEITLYRTFGVKMDDIWDVVIDRREEDPSWKGYVDEDELDSDNEYSSEEYQDDGITINDLMDILNKYMGITEPNEFRKGEKVVVKRGKESSWSTSPQVSSSFSDKGTRDFNVMVKTKVPASLVVADLNLLPKQLLQDKFRYWTQNEVILDKAEIPAVIANVWISEEARDWLSENDYKFSPTKGIIDYWE